MATEIKFCGLTRPEDASLAVDLGAAYVGTIFAGGPRHLTIDQARAVYADVGDTVRRVGVFANADVDAIRRTVETLRLSVVQLHGDSTLLDAETIRASTGADVWMVVRIAGDVLPTGTSTMLSVAQAVLLDAKVEGTLGGTGVRLPWAAIGLQLVNIRGSAKIVLAGGLNSTNVAQAVRELQPDVVDVSSGVESAPGIKDHKKMRAFAQAVNG